MSQKNGCIRFCVKDGGTFIQIMPPQEGGTAVALKLVMRLLEAKSFNDYNLKDLSEAITRAESEEQEVFVGPAPFRPIPESIQVSVSSDKMLVFMTAFQGSEGGNPITKEEVLSELSIQKITNGILEDVIDDFIQNKEFCKEIVICKGKPALNGSDAKIEYFFNRNLNTKPKKNEDGSVDYHSLDTISGVEKGQRLALLVKEVPGENGYDVYGNIIKPRDVKALKLEYGNNIDISEDKTELFSAVTGHASLVGNKVFVSDIFEVPADVDNGTGDINFSGSVHVKGNVKSGFKIVAHGDIIVDGVVEGAHLISDGQIIIKRGIHGMTKGILESKSNVVSKFIENATVRSGGYVETESILHSNVSAFSEVIVSGRKGFIMGGLVRASKRVEVKSLGSDMGTMTQIEVGIEPAKKERYGKLRDELVKRQKEMDQIKPILVTFTQKINSGEEIAANKKAYIQQLAQQFRQMKDSADELKFEYNLLTEELSLGSDARVKVQNTVYPGVRITISDVSLTTKDERSFCQFVRENGEVIVKNL